MNMECIVYMGKTDVERQHANVQKMEMLGATVIPRNFWQHDTERCDQ